MAVRELVAVAEGLLTSLLRAAGDRLAILAGGGVRGNHVRELVHAAGLCEVHARAAAIPGVVAACAELP